MPIKILTEDGSGAKASGTKGFNTLGDNECLAPIIANTFGWEAIYIQFTDDSGETTNYPACRKGKRMVMLPHFSYGPGANADEAAEIMKELKAQGYFCEWRLTAKASEYCYTDKTTSFLPLETGSDKQFRHLKSNVKRKIRKSAANGIITRSGNTELLDDFYSVYSRNMHRLGSPALPRRWFANLLKQYSGGEAGIWCSYLNDKAIGAAFLLEYRGFYEACWFSTLGKYNKLYTSYGLYWQMIHHATEQKAVIFSFGRSTAGSGVHTYKQQWGGQDLQLYWNYSHPQAKNIRNFTFLTKLWKLLPYPLARIIGPFISGRFY